MITQTTLQDCVIIMCVVEHLLLTFILFARDEGLEQVSFSF